MRSLFFNKFLDLAGALADAKNQMAKTTKKKTQTKNKIQKKPIAKIDARVFALHPTAYFRYAREGALAVIKLEDPEILFQIDGLAMELFLAINGERNYTEVITYLMGNPRPKNFPSVIKEFLADLIKAGLVVRIK